MSQNNGVTVSPSPKKSNFRLGMHSKNISQCQDSDDKTDEELNDGDCGQKQVENSSDESSNPPSPSQKKNKLFKKIFHH